MGYRLQVLGSVGLVREGETEPILSMGKPLALIVYLAFSPRHAASREHLVDLLWADADPDSARRNLRQALYHIRRVLGGDFIVAEGERLRLRTDMPSDAAAFLTAIDRGDLAEGIDAYTGPFFPAFAAPGGAEFERWADLERRRLRTMYLRALEASAREALQRHRLRDAEALARRMRDEAPGREAGWRLLIEALVSAEDWVRAAAEADACEDRFVRDGRTAEPATIAALNAARQAPAPTSTSTRLVAEMVAREREFATIASAWDDAAGGRFRQLHVIGAAGIGKTRLLRDAAARIRASGGLVVSTRANPGERHLPYALAGDLTRALCELPGAPGIAPATAGVLVGLDPALSARFPAALQTHPAAEDLLRLRAMALSDLIDAVATDHPLAILLDDLHWSDTESRQLAVAVAARLRATPTLLVTCTRPVPDAPPWATPEETVTLRPLGPKHVEALVESIATIPDGLLAAGLVGILHEVTDGSPLLILEALQHVSDRELLVRKDGSWTAPDPPALLLELAEGEGLRHRLATLPVSERRLLLAVAAAGTPVPDGVLATLARQQVGGDALPVRALERRGYLVRRDDGRWECAHDVISETLIETASRDETRQAHSALGEHLLRLASDDPESVRSAVRHLAVGGAHDLLEPALATYIKMRRRSGDRRPASALVRAVLADALPPDAITALVRALPLRLRITRPMWIATGTAAAALLVVLTAWWVSQPVTLEIAQTAHFMEEVSSRHPIIVDAVNRIGTPAYQHRDTVYASLAETYDYPLALAGDTAVALRAGRAAFGNLEMRWGAPPPGSRQPGAVRLKFRIPGLGSIVSDSLFAGGGGMGIYLDSGLVNGQALTPAQRVVYLRTGEHVRGTVHLHYRSNVGTAALLLAAIPNWGDRTWNFGAARALSSRTVNDTVHQGFDFPGPTTPGRYWMAFIAAAETEARFIASGTNWALLEPVWYDGDDIVDFGPEEIRALETDGQVLWSARGPSGDHPTQPWTAMPVSPAEVTRWIEASDSGPRTLIGTVIHVVVE